MAKALLTRALVVSATCPAGSAKHDIFDEGCKGLMLEIRPTGYKAYYLRYSDERGKQRQLKLADARDLTLEQARKKAEQFRVKIAMGEDPVVQKAERKTIPTFGEFIRDRYLPYVDGYKKAAWSDRSYLNNQILCVFH